MTASEHLIIIITGTPRGMGAALMEALLQPGNRIVCVARSCNPDLERLASESGVPVAWHQQDLSQPGRATSWLVGTLEAVDETPASATLILNAGIAVPIAPIANLREAELVTSLFTSLAAPMAMTAAFLKHTERLGCQRKVLAISSGAARRPFEGMSPYSAGKAGLDMFMRSVNAEYAQLPAERAVRAVSLAPVQPIRVCRIPSAAPTSPMLNDFLIARKKESLSRRMRSGSKLLHTLPDRTSATKRSMTSEITKRRTTIIHIRHARRI
ncbi:hypothetical protein R69746_06400 [Paraburkholderia aspalathi]|nr:hypothetical protein R69746_06400 [Paraburkholderia aspalathi]